MIGNLPVRGLVAGAASTALTILVVGCGAGASPSSVAQLGSTATTTTGTRTGPSATGKYPAQLAYSRCMRSHGVPNFPDPKQAGEGIQISGSRSGMNPQSPSFISAQRACRNLLPGGGRPTYVDQQRALSRMLQSSRCMRAHGVSGFPDPTLSPPSARSGYSEIMSNGVAWLAIPDSIDVQSPAVQRAAAACKLSLS